MRHLLAILGFSISLTGCPQRSSVPLGLEQPAVTWPHYHEAILGDWKAKDYHLVWLSSVDTNFAEILEQLSVTKDKVFFLSTNPTALKDNPFVGEDGALGYKLGQYDITFERPLEASFGWNGDTEKQEVLLQIQAMSKTELILNVYPDKDTDRFVQIRYQRMSTETSIRTLSFDDRDMIVQALKDLDFMVRGNGHTFYQANILKDKLSASLLKELGIEGVVRSLHWVAENGDDKKLVPEAMDTFDYSEEEWIQDIDQIKKSGSLSIYSSSFDDFSKETYRAHHFKFEDEDGASE